MLIVERVAALHRIDLFAATPGSILAAVAAAAEEVTLDAGEVLIEAGAVEDTLYAILTGRVQVLVNGRVLVEAGPGSTVGELAVLVAEPRSATVVTLEPSGFLRVRKATVDDLIADHPAFATSIIAALVARLRTTSAHLETGIEVTVDRTRATVLLLAAQAVWFGVAAALLVIPANGIFLAAYGAEWLPLTYVGIALLGTTVSVVIARSLRRWTLPTVSIAVLAAFAADAAGHLGGHRRHGIGVALGGPADDVPDPAPARVRDHRRPGRTAPRPPADQAVLPPDRRRLRRRLHGRRLRRGAAARPARSPEHLVVVSAASCVVFMGLVGVTARRRPAELTVVDRPAETTQPAPCARCSRPDFVVLVFVYQMLSAMGSQVLDFLVFDRAAARYDDAAELTRFVAVYTGVLNAVDLVFLAVLAAWLLLRFGLRLGLVANPAAVTALDDRDALRRPRPGRVVAGAVRHRRSQPGSSTSR